MPHHNTDSTHRLLEQIAAVFDDDAPHSASHTRAATVALNAVAAYLADGLGPNRASAVPSAADLSHVALALHAATASLHSGLTRVRTAIDRHEPLYDDGDWNAIQLANIRAALRRSSAALHAAAIGLGELHRQTTPAGAAQSNAA